MILNHNTQQQSATVFNILSVIEQQHYTIPPEQQATTTMLKQIETTKNNLAKTMDYCLVKIGQMITGPLMRVASVIAVAGVIFCAGLVVLPISDTQARNIVYESTIQAMVSTDVTEPTGNSGTTEVSYDFVRVESEAREFSNVSLAITVDTAKSTAREGVDFTIPENQTIDASIANPSPANRVRVMLLADTFKEGRRDNSVKSNITP